MTMTPYNGDMLQALKWMQNNAPNLQSLISQKAAWYQTYQDNFWSDWETNVFDLRTANNFGLAVWCAILGLPQTPFNLVPVGNSWAYGKNRQNYVYSGVDTSIPSPNTTGGNFYGSSQDALNSLDEIRWALQLRYVALTGNSRLSLINRMLQYIFNGGQPWDFANKKYAYVTDSTMATVGASGISVYRNDWQGNQLMYSTARTNNLKYSQDFTQSAWTKSSSYTLTAAATTAPDGTTTGQKLADNSTTSTGHSLYQVASSVSSQATASWTIYAKASERQYLLLRLISVTTSGNYCYCGFDLVNGTFQVGNTGTATGATATMTPMSNGWYRCTLTGLPDPAGTGGVQAYTHAPLTITGSNTYVGTVGAGIFIWGGQLEVGPATSYIPTTTAAVTQTDYTLNPTTGAVTFAVAPLTGAALTYSGSYKQGTAVNQSFGTGNGSTTVFNLTTPPGGGIPTTGAFKIEYRFGAGLGLSAQFINLLNGDYGILPAPCGSSVLAIQES